MADMTREDITDILEEIALLLELKGENPFKIRAYRNGADAITSYGDDFLQKDAAGHVIALYANLVQRKPI